MSIEQRAWRSRLTLGYSQELRANLALHVDGDFSNVESDDR